MADELNLNAYFERIGFAGSIAPTLLTLQTLQLSHALAIPYENLDPLMGVASRLDPQSLENKLIRDRRGGRCFEQNMLLLRALRTMDFTTTAHSARGLLGRKPGVLPPRNHMLISVDLGGVLYLADVGFGGMVLTAPLRMRPDVEQETPHGTFRITGEEPEYVMEGRMSESEEWRQIYRFTLEPELEVDFEVANWYGATNPEGFMRNTLLVERPAKGGVRHLLFNAELRTQTVGGAQERRALTSVAEIKEVLAGTFGISLPPAEQLDPALEKILAVARPA
jgi:N-hydroxyarylamine O-acetyltransferase